MPSMDVFDIASARDRAPANPRETGAPRFRLAPLARAIAVLVAAGGALETQAQQAFSPAWFAGKGAAQSAAAATGRLPNGQPALPRHGPRQQQQQARDKLQTSIGNLNLAARAIAAQQSAQAAARAAALAAGSTIPDGLGEGGLQVDTNSLTAGWHNAKAPTQSVADGKTTVTIEQTADRAILNWETFNVGRNTTVKFDQETSWSALNRVNDPLARPSEIQGNIEAPGTVLIVNRNGIVFDGSSQINVRNLVAAAAHIEDGQFTERGLYGADHNTPSFTDAAGAVVVKQGALVRTHEPQTVTQGGGYVLLLGETVDNAGEIVTRKGQAALAAGDHFVIRKGVGTEVNTFSTTRGSEIAALRGTDSAAGGVRNAGLIQAREGDITLTGHDVRQEGVAVATTTVNTRGTVHLLNARSDATGSVTLGEGSTTAVLIEDDGNTTALDSQRDALIKESAEQDALRVNAIDNGAFDNYARLTDRRDQSRVEIVSGDNVHFARDSLTLATGGQIALDAVGRSFVAERAVLDVAGAVGVQVAMEANSVRVNVQGNELRDSPQNRDSGKLANANVWVDARDLIYVPAGQGGYESERWYTADGLLELSGYLGNRGHRAGEWAAQGGTVTLSGNEVITQAGSQVNIAGGTLDVSTGYVNQSWLRTVDGQVHALGSGPVGAVYAGLYTGYHAEHARWDVNESFYSPLLAPQRRLENGYTVGRDAGALVVDAPTAVIEGDIHADVFNGERQTHARARGAADGYKLGQHTVARAGALALARRGMAGGAGPHDSDVKVGDIAGITSGMVLTDALASDRTGTTWFDAAHLNALALGGLTLETRGSIAIDADLALADGGEVELVAPVIDIGADVTARSGSISATNLFQGDYAWSGPAQPLLDADGGSRIALREGASLDARGLWANTALDEGTADRLSRIDGGEVRLASTHDVILEHGSLIDVSSGAAVLAGGETRGGSGGDIALTANLYTGTSIVSSGRLALDGVLLGYGVEGGGKLSVGGSPVLIADHGAVPDAGHLLLTPDFFRTGFSHYEIKGSIGVPSSITVADGTALAVEMPVWRLTAAAQGVPTAADAAPFEIWTPPLHVPQPSTGTVSQRKGASLAFVDAGAVNIGTGSLIEVDPGQSISIQANGQVTIDGRLNAWGGAIAINARGGANEGAGVVPGRSIWIGDNAVLDVAARAVMGVDLNGRAFAQVPNGGAIRIGVDDLDLNGQGLLDSITTSTVVIRPGAVLDASGAGAPVDLAGADPLARPDAGTLASHGGSIILASSSGLVLDGELRAAAGGAGAAGGSLDLILEGHYNAPEQTRVPRILTIAQARQPSSMPIDLAPGQDHAALGHARARFSAEQVRSGGFDSLSLWSADIISFEGDVALDLGRSLTLQRGVIAVAETTPDARIALKAPVVRFDGSVRRDPSGPLNGIYSGLKNVAAGAWRPATSHNAGSLTVEADLIDIGNWVSFGASDRYDIDFVPGSHNNTVSNPIEAPGFADIHFFSRGDIRFRDGSLATAGDLTLTAAQLYPVTGARATILAGAATDGGSSVRPRPDSVLAIRGNGQPAQPPFSVFGALGLIAGTIEQDGVLRAPLGSILFGKNAGGAGFHEYQSGGRVMLRDGSTTSVSAAGLIVPYGGTVDGLKYDYDGRELSFRDLMALDAMGRIEINADRFEAGSGAVLDLTGGGELAGAGFVAGRGGSVDILRTPLVNANPAFDFSASGNAVYAIVPGFASGYAPVMQETGAGDPAVGRQITVPEGIPGLAAGTYTLLPSTFAVLPGAYRVEIGGVLPRQTGVTAVGNGSYITGAYLGIANTAIRTALPEQVVLTPGKALRSHSQYNETGYSGFALEQAARFGTTRARLPVDGKQLVLTFEEAGDALDFDGTALFAPGEGGYAGTLLVQGLEAIEIKASGAAATADMVALDAQDLSRFDAGTLFVGGSYFDGGSGNVYLRTNLFTGNGSAIAVRSGAVLEAGQILLAGNDVLVEDGAVLDTSGSRFAVPDSTLGYVFANGNTPDDVNFGAMLVVANGWFNLLPAVAPQDGRPSRLAVADGAILRTRGTIGFVAADQLSLGQAQLNARYLALSLPAVNVGTEASLAAAAAAGVLGTGWNLTQTTLDRLLNPATTDLAALERLSFSARDGINFYGDVSLDARNRAGGPAETLVVLNTPAIYGWGDANTSARLAADQLVWNGIATGTGTVQDPYASLQPPAVLPGGAGTGSGRLTFAAEEIHFGYDPLARSQNSAELERLALGFSTVDLIAGGKVTANNRGRVSVYRSGTDAASYVGGDLTITTPLFTADSGAMIDIRAGGAITVNALEDTADPSRWHDLGGEIRLSGGAIALDTTVALPSGRLVMHAEGDIRLGDRALIDLAGRAVSFYDVTQYSWGGDLELQSRAGSIAQAAGSVIDVSARNNDAGAIKVSAVNGAATFAGTLRGEASGGDAGSFALAAHSIADFAALNGLLNASGFFGERGFTTKSGDLVVGDEVKARVVDISVDGGSLIVNGRVDASGDKVGTIRLSARDNLTLAAGATLDVHGTVLQTDAHGAAIEASNRGSIELTTKQGVVTLAAETTIDLRSADGVARGRLEINAPRVGVDSVAVNAANRVDILGAASIAVNGFRGYSPLDGIINQVYLDGIHADSTAFIDAAHGNSALQGQLAGLGAYGSAFHLRPGVEIAGEGDLATQGDLDLSGYRYGPAVDPGVYGSGEAGVFVVRAGGDLNINGSINDGFAPPPPTQDDYNWADGRAGQLWAVSPMLEPGSQSWSLRFVSGADLAASDTRAIKPLHALGDGGDLVLEDPHLGGDWLLEAVSVVRTGTGYLDLITGGDYRHASLFGVYTAGSALTQTQNHTGFWLTEGGGDVRIEAGGTLAGYSYMSGLDTNQRRINEWLRGDDNGAWGINFGAYVLDGWWLNELVGFAGIGALGGGNVRVIAGGDAGVLSPQHVVFNPNTGIDETRASGLVIAIGGGGYRDDNGALHQTGGGDLTLKIGGRLNTSPLYESNYSGGGMLVNVRGDVSVSAAAVGLVSTINYGRPQGYPDPRPIDPTRPYEYRPDGGLTLALGDSRATVNTRGDLIILHATDPGATDPASAGGVYLPSISAPGFSLWTDRTAIDLFSAGGSVAPITSYDRESGSYNDYYSYENLADRRPYPPALGAVAAGGDVLVFGRADLRPLANARLELLARDSIHYGYNPSGEGNYLTVWGSGFEDSTLSEPIRFYALNGDITNIRTGYLRAPTFEVPEPAYVSGGPVWIRAGRDIIAGGGLDDPTSDWANEAGIGGLIVHSRDDDVSIIDAGRDIIFANFSIGGPGLLEITAGRDIYQSDAGSIVSIGPVAAGDTRPGASIALMAGLADGADWAALRSRYLDPANLADPGRPLADQDGKVAKVYGGELADWLGERYGFTGTDEEALAAFDALAPEQQRIFLRALYYAELRAGGREYNDADGPRFGSYLRGREMIATLFPDSDAEGNTIERRGDIILYGGSGVRTNFGGDIEMLAPGGQIVVGVQGEVPPPSAGVMTQGSGDIRLFSERSLLLGLSRIMTTFGGDIFAWSEQGDINAGRGAKTTVLFTPPRRSYDDVGNVALAPQVPSSGAGIATLDPIPEVPPGDIDLIAPLGTIDAGEAGIRVSGNVNLAALQVVNAENIQVKGEATGIPAVAAVNVAALTDASAAANSAASAAREVMQRERAATRRNLPSVFTVRVLGFGAGPDQGNAAPAAGARYDVGSAFQVLGQGALDARQRARLTEAEQRRL